MAFIPVTYTAAKHVCAGSLGITTYITVVTGIRGVKFSQWMSGWTNSIHHAVLRLGLENSGCDSKGNPKQNEKARRSANQPGQGRIFVLSWGNARLICRITFHSAQF
jgi:hypothetical protein